MTIPQIFTIEQQRKRAKELLRAWRAQMPEAYARVRAVGFAAEAADDDPKLSIAQAVIARELGLPSWPQLRDHAADMQRAHTGMLAGERVDGERTVHIRCGSDIQERLQEAGCLGQFIEFSDPYCQGPVPMGDDAILLVARARFIASAYMFPADEPAIHSRLQREYAAIDGLLSTDEPKRQVVLWFEHDPYDQCILAHLLARLQPVRHHHDISMVSTDRFPAIARFNGFGQCEPEALRVLYTQRISVPPEAWRGAVAFWDALRSSTPEYLNHLAHDGVPGMPYAQNAIQRLLAEYPSSVNGISLTEQLTLQQLSAGPRTGQQLFAVLNAKLEPLTFLGDAMFVWKLRRLVEAADPLLERRCADSATDRPWLASTYVLTAAGQAVWSGQRDLESCGVAPRWVGGVELFDSGPDWRWHADRQVVLPVSCG